MIDTLNSDMCALLFLMILRPPRSTRTDTLFPDTTRFRSHAAPLGVGIVAALERDVDERVGDGVDLRLPHQRHQLGRIVVVHGMHGGEMGAGDAALQPQARSEEHTSELQSLMRISYAVFCLKKKKTHR